MKSKTLLCLLAGSALVIMGLTFPRDIALERTIEVDAPVAQAYRTVKDLNSWTAWSPWRDVDPSIRFAKPQAGPAGALQCRWSGKIVGEGWLRVVAARSGQRLETALYRSGELLVHERWVFRPLANGRTQISWRLSGRLPWRRAFRSLARTGPGLGHGLNLLKAEVETRPRD